MSKCQWNPTLNSQLSTETETKKKNNEKIWLLNLNPKIMYDCHTDRKIPNFFSIRYSMTQKLFIFDPYFGPPFWTLSLPSNLASKSHTNIFLWWPKSIYFCNSSLFLSLNQKKKLKKSTKKEKLPKKIEYHPWGRRKKRFVSDKKFRKGKKLLLNCS